MENSGKISKRIKLGMAITFVAFAVGSPFLWSLLY
jgi:geranylgeranylglycerol-phosphate geranylgeranyltransferase